MYNKILKDILSLRDDKKAKFLAGFFKTGKGQYGEGDVFLGITVPESRKIAVKYKDLSFSNISKLLKNKYHEVRLIALLILVHKYKFSPIPGIGENSTRTVLVEFYLKNTKYINNWDLVDLSASYILGDYLYQNYKIGKSSPRPGLGELVKSKNIWERRIAVIATFAFIYKGESKWTIEMVKILLKDHHDLIQKACGWMLREVGKRVSEIDLTSFLDIYGSQMPRTMLRYAIERLPEKKRLYYLKKDKI